MRVFIGLAVLVAGCTGALAQSVGPGSGAAPASASPIEASPVIVPRQNDDALARQAAVEKRIADRNRRVVRSVCQGCGGAADRPAHSRKGRGRPSEPEPRETPIADPAQAPVD